jgi:two-component system, cell cycle sensor histidine kinase and response regulator CckA
MSDDLRRSLVEQSLMGIAIAQGAPPRCVFVNRTFADFVGREPEDLLALEPGGLLDLVHPEDRERFRARYETKLEGGEATPEFLLRALRPNGSVRWLRLASTRLEWEDAPAVQAVFIDVTERVRAEEERFQSSMWTEKLLETTLDGFLLADATGEIRSVNQAYCEMTGFRRGELIGSDIRDREAMLSPAEVDARIGEIMAAGNLRFETRHETAHGPPIDLEVSLTVVDAEGEPLVAAFLRDIGPQLRAHAALEEREARYRALFQDSPVSLWDEDCSAVKERLDELAATPGVELRSYLGEHPEEVARCATLARVRAVNRATLDMFREPDAERLVERLDLTFTDQAFDVFREELLALHGGASHFEAEARFRTTEGDELLTEMVVGIAPGHEDKWDRILVSMTDLTARVHAERALRDSEKKYRHLIEGSSDPIYLLRDQRFELVNEAFLTTFGLDRAALDDPDFDLLSIVAPESRNEVAERLEHIRKGADVPPTFRFQGIRSDGKQLVLEASVSFIRDQRGVAHQGTLRDITERESLERQLRQAQKMEALGRLAGGVAHDFNNLLTAINGFTELALQSVSEESPLHADLSQVREAGRRGEQLTRQILAFSRRQILNPTSIDPNAMVRGMERLIRRVIGEDVIWRFEPGTVAPIKADPGQLDQVLLNLAVNARDAMPEGGTLTVRTRLLAPAADGVDPLGTGEGGPFVRISVTDTGTGIPEGIRNRIFEPFFSTKEPGRGTGLGLSTVYGIVRQSRGSLSVESTLGEGTTFHIDLPVLSEADVENHASSPRTDHPVESAGERILVVEDDDAVRAFVSTTLLGLGYTIMEATNGTDALEILRTADPAPDLTLTDVVMPGASGAEVARASRAAGIPAVMMTGYLDDRVQSDVLPDDEEILRKPFTPAGLSRHIRGALHASGGESSAPDPGS